MNDIHEVKTFAIYGLTKEEFKKFKQACVREDQTISETLKQLIQQFAQEKLR